MQTKEAEITPSVLVVDDNPLIVNIVAKLLSAENYQVATASNGREALQQLGNRFFDVIVCDVMMPEMDGYQLHDVVRTKANLSHIPFIFLSALSDPGDVMQGKETGADDYMVKPFEPTELLSVVKGKVTRSRTLRAVAEEQYESYRKRVVHVLSHEFRTPLVAIATGTELLLENKDSLDPDKVRDLLEAIHRGGQRLERLVGDFMLVQQIEAGIAHKLFEARARELTLGHCAQQFFEAQTEALTKEGCIFRFVNRAGDVRVKLYEPHIHDVFTRLLSNVRKFKSERFECEVIVSSHEQWGIIDVSDRGIGLEIDKVNEAINLFGQLNRDKMEQQGSGFGLAIASRFCNVAGGKLEFASRQGGGTKVRIRLPLITNDAS